MAEDTPGLSEGQPVGPWFFQAIQEMLSGAANNFTVQYSANTLTVPSGTGAAQASIAIGTAGVYRYVSAAVSTTVSGAAGQYDLYATAVTANVYGEETDETDRTFRLAVVAHGSAPSGVYDSRLVATFYFDGTNIAWLQQLVQTAAPVNAWPGKLEVSASQYIPPGWLACNGSAVSRAGYPALFAAIGTHYGAGDGSTTFNLPDYRDAVVVGAGGSFTLGQIGGENTHVLTPAESGVNGNGSTVGTSSTGNQSQDHVHSVAGGSFYAATTTYGDDGYTVSSGAQAAQPVNNVPQTNGSSEGHEHPIPAIELNAREADAAHNNMQKYAAANILIRVI